MIEDIKNDLQKYATRKNKEVLQRFFKTGPGEYGEGDVFLGVKVPDQRKVAKIHKDIPLDEVSKLMNDKIHECRLTGVIILVNKFKISNEKNQTEIVRFYLDNLKGVNNWDLVDLSAPYILGGWLVSQLSNIIYHLSNKSQNPKAIKNNPYTEEVAKKMARSKNLWERRIAMMSTFGLIRNYEFDLALEIAEILLKDEHDLIHKAVGWMLREIGKKSMKTEEKFLKEHYKNMPRTMLRYAIEKFPEEKRQNYLKGFI